MHACWDHVRPVSLWGRCQSSRCRDWGSTPEAEAERGYVGEAVDADLPLRMQSMLSASTERKTYPVIPSGTISFIIPSRVFFHLPCCTFLEIPHFTAMGSCWRIPVAGRLTVTVCSGNPILSHQVGRKKDAHRSENLGFDNAYFRFMSE